MALTDSQRLAVVTPTITVDTSAYASGDVVGGLLELTNATRGSNKDGLNHGGLIVSVGLTDAAGQDVALDVLFFHTEPTNSTFTDNDPLAVDGDDLAKMIPRPVSLAAADYVSLGTPSVVGKSELAIPFRLPLQSTSLWAVIVSRGAPTYTAVTDLRLSVGILQG